MLCFGIQLWKETKWKWFPVLLISLVKLSSVRLVLFKVSKFIVVVSAALIGTVVV